MPVERVTVREVGPRDGFQNEPERIDTADKIRLIDALARTGLKRLEVASFVRADVIPQLSDAVEVLHGIDVPDDVDLAVLVPNERGLETALEHQDRFDEVLVFLSASETHNRKNVNRPVADSLAAIERMLPRIADAGLRPMASIADLLRLPLRGPRRRRTACSSWPSGWPPPAPRRSASATPPAWPTRARSREFYRATRANGCPASS